MKLANGLRRLQGAAGRHGLRNLASIALGALRTQGLKGTFRLAAGDQPFLSVAEPAPIRRRTARLWPPELDERGRLTAPAWARWLSARPRPAATAAQGRRIVFAICRREGEDEASRRTREAILALWPEAAILDTSVDGPVAAEIQPEALYVFLQAGDIPEPELPAALAPPGLPPQAQVATFDFYGLEGEQVRPLFAPGANPPLIGEDDYVRSRAAIAGEALLGLPPGPANRRIAAWAQARSVAEVREGWRHAPRPLVRIPMGAGLARHTLPEPASSAGRTPRPSAGGASAIICTRDKGHLARQLVRQLLRLGPEQLAEVVIMANGTANPYALKTLADLAGDPRVTVARADEPFNFSRLCNAGVRHTRSHGPLLFLNDDISPVSEDWLSILLARLDEPGTGAVGPLLLYPDERVQHAGMYLRFPDGAGHYLRGARLPQDDLFGLTSAAREVSCLTGAVLLTDRDAFTAVGGFDEALAISFQDVDYGLKLHAAGLRNLFEPRSVLVHMESVSLHNANTDPVLLAQRHREKTLMLERWSGRMPRDPFFPGGLDPADERLRRLSRS